MRKSKHTIDFLFPIALFFVFACTSLVVLLFSANTYEKIVAQSNNNFESGTCLAYITEKIRQNDSDGSISISSIDGITALSIQENIDNHLFNTYIYEYEGTLRELYVQDGVSVSPKTGTIIMDINKLEMKELDTGLLEIKCTLSDGSIESVSIGITTK